MIVRFLALLCMLAAVSAPAHARRSQVYAPANDDLAAAATLAPSSQLTAGTVEYASREAGEPAIDATAVGRSVWYRFTAPATGRMVAVLASGGRTASPLRIAVWSGRSVATLRRLGRASLVARTGRAVAGVAFDAVARTSYLISVDDGRRVDPEGRFLVGVAQGPAAGGAMLFSARPTIVPDEQSGPGAELFAVNGLRVAATLSATLSANLAGALAIDGGGVLLASGAATVLVVRDVGGTPLAKVGTTTGTLTALLSAGGRTLGTGVLGAHGVRRVPDAAPAFVVRFEHPGQGVRAAMAATSRVLVENVSADDAAGCRFDAGDRALTLAFAEVQGTALRNAGVPFALAAGDSKTFSVSVAGPPDDGDSVRLSCAHRSAGYPDDDLSRMWGYEQFGPAARVLFAVPDADDHDRIALPDFGFRVVVVSVQNAGEYAGFFGLSYRRSDRSRAEVSSMCLSTEAGMCLGPPTQGTIEVNLGTGESAHVALYVTRKDDPAGGFVTLAAEAIDSPAAHLAGTDGFEVVPATAGVRPPASVRARR